MGLEIELSTEWLVRWVREYGGTRRQSEHKWGATGRADKNSKLETVNGGTRGFQQWRGRRKHREPVNQPTRTTESAGTKDGDGDGRRRCGNLGFLKMFGDWLLQKRGSSIL